ncbi:MAG: enoyl-CoA hydratase/isomerase family protein [Acidimicrobiales bacterium]
MLAADVEADAVRYASAGGVVTLTMAQPETRNALTPELLAGLAGGLARAEADPAVRAVVLTHDGPVFCAGADLRSGRAPTAAGGGAGAADLPAVLAAIQDSPLPVVARLAGSCYGGGVGLAAAADLSVAADDVRLGFTEVRLGVAPAVVSVVCLPKLRRGDALELFLTGERITAARAVDAGLLTRAVPAADLDEAVTAIVKSLVAGGPRALAAAKRLVYAAPARDRTTALAETAALSAELFESEEAAEGRAAFREKRPPAWAADR